MFPIAVLTWRLGNLDSDAYESIIPSTEHKTQIYEEFLNLTDGTFFMETCQRIIVVVETNKTWIIDELVNKYYGLLGLGEDLDFEPEVFLGLDGLHHLAKVVSGLDSVVLGEHEIQYQFKDAYRESEPYLGNNLKTYMQSIIRIGKRVRQKIQLDGTSTIEAVETVHLKQFQNANSISLIGTGKMGLLSLKYLKDYADKIHLYSTIPDRVGDQLEGKTILPLSQLDNSEIIITATSKAKFITSEFISRHNLENLVLLVDLGMPRNCNPEISKNKNITVIDIERLVETADTSNRIRYISEAMNLIEQQVDRIIKEYHQQLQSKIIVDLRSDLSNFADCNKPDFIDDKNEKDYQQFINAMIHISQKHIEKVIFEGSKVND